MLEMSWPVAGSTKATVSSPGVRATQDCSDGLPGLIREVDVNALSSDVARGSEACGWGAVRGWTSAWNSKGETPRVLNGSSDRTRAGLADDLARLTVPRIVPLFAVSGGLTRNLR